MQSIETEKPFNRIIKHEFCLNKKKIGTTMMKTICTRKFRKKMNKIDEKWIILSKFLNQLEIQTNILELRMEYLKLNTQWIVLVITFSTYTWVLN